MGPIIETSSNLRIAPLALAYPGIAVHLQSARLDPKRNFWNAVFDFSSPDDSHKNWRLADLGECLQYNVSVEAARCGGGRDLSAVISAEDSLVFPTVTDRVLRAVPLSSG